MNNETDRVKVQRVFSPGELVIHPKYGRGMVLGRRADGSLRVKFEARSKADILFPQLLEPAREEAFDGNGRGAPRGG